MNNFHERKAECLSRLDNLFDFYLKKPSCASETLQEAMAYGVFNGGKRVRPLLVYFTGLTLGTPLENLDAPACAIELIHSYSLIHDDLPAMDNADLRRGKPSCHKAYNEALAILAGDSLQTLAFEIIANHDCQLSPDQRLAMINHLAKTSGPNGMAGGQALDMEASVNSVEDILNLYQLKTGLLISAGVNLGLLSAPSLENKTKQALTSFAQNLGLAFQLQDDLLDLESTPDILGKPTELDKTNNKKTYPHFKGKENTREKINHLYKEAQQCLSSIKNAELLQALSDYLIKRDF